MTSTAQLEAAPTAIIPRIAEALAYACRERFATSLRAFILIGSAARGEVTHRLINGRVQMLSDVEALAVLQDSVPLPSRHYVAELCSASEARLQSGGIDTHVSISCVHASYLRKLPPHIFTFELRNCGVVLCGDPEVLGDISSFAPSEISREDGWRLLSNRLIEALPRSANIEPADAYSVIKLCLDLASSLLVFLGKFEASYAARLRAFEALASDESVRQVPVPLDEFLPALRACTSAKLNSEPAVEIDPQLASKVRLWAWRLWAWELAQLTGAQSESPQEMIRALGHDLSWSSRLRGWLFAARRVGWLRSVAHWPRWLLLFAKGFTPRHAIYLAAHECRTANTAEKWTDVYRLLPCVNRGDKTSGDGVAAPIHWNYQEFVADTRA